MDYLDAVLALHRATHHTLHALSSAMADLNLTAAEINALANLADRGALNVRELSAETGTRATTLTGVLDRLENRGYLTRELDPTDRRSFRLPLTEAGQAAADAGPGGRRGPRAGRAGPPVPDPDRRLPRRRRGPAGGTLMPGHVPTCPSPPARHRPPDPELAAILPGITGPGGQFRHRQHINLAFYAVRRYGMPDAIGADLRLDPADRRVRTGAAEVSPHRLAGLGGTGRAPCRRGPGLRGLRRLRRPESRAAGQAPASQALPLVDPGRRTGSPRLG